MDAAQRQRYSRQILFPGIGEAGQEALLAAHVVVVGCGALGSFHVAALARAGVGRITVVDRDYVEPSNLHRQWLFEESDAAQALPKAAAAARRVAAINSSVEVRPMVADLTASNAEELLAPAQVILDGTDNFETRYLINDFAISRGIPWIYGAAVGSYGLTMPVIPGRTACLRCVYPDPPAIPAAHLRNRRRAERHRLRDRLHPGGRRAEDPHRPRRRGRSRGSPPWTCGRAASARSPPPRPTPIAPPAPAASSPTWKNPHREPVTLCGRNAVQIHERGRPVDLADLEARLAPLGEVRANEFALRFMAAPYELTIFPDGRTIVKGTSDLGVARSLYARYVG